MKSGALLEYTVGYWPWQILGAIHTVATSGERGETVFYR